MWRAHPIEGKIIDEKTTYILKRMRVSDPAILRCCLREIYFGKLLKNRPIFTHLVTYFVQNDDYWLVFKDEGVSLRSMMYASTFDGTNVFFEPSEVWRRLRTTSEGAVSLQGLTQHVVEAVSQLHSMQITHRGGSISTN